MLLLMFCRVFIVLVCLLLLWVLLIGIEKFIDDSCNILIVFLMVGIVLYDVNVFWFSIFCFWENILVMFLDEVVILLGCLWGKYSINKL